MLKRFCYSILLITIMLQANAQDSITARIVLIGDAGQLTNGYQPVITAAKNNVVFDNKTTVVFLGDNLYKTGLPDDALPNYNIAKAPLDSQIVIARNTPSKVYFIPGNHDWANGGENGYESIKRVVSYISFLGDENVKALPVNGCPGPVEVEINSDITLVIMDSQWWLHEEDKPGIESDCETKNKDEILSELDELLSKNSKKLILLAMHHPSRSYGPHGGYFTLKQHIFPLTDINPKLYIPLPIIGSGYPLTRAVFGTIQDLKHPLYQDLIKKVGDVVKGYKNVIYVSGHEHNLQLIQDSAQTYIVSGSGSKTNRVSKGPDALFVSPEMGFFELEISKAKNVKANVYTVVDSAVTKEYSEHILNFATIDVEAGPDTMRRIEYAYKDTVVISASDQYKQPSGFRKLMLGTNYREEWGTPVAMKEFNINKEKGGFTIESLGGGKQTRSLKLKDKNGKEWSLRSIDKDPEKAVPENLRGTIAQEIVQDAISASNPYAPLTVSRMAEALGIITGKPELFFIPNDPAFGIYQKTFANTVAMLEDRDPTPDGSDTKSTASVIDKLVTDNDNSVKQGDVLTARFLDMLIGDYDRHADQWKWGKADTGKGSLYYPVPRDRDQAYFKSNGLIEFFVAHTALPYLKGFKTNMNDINRFNMVAKDFDRFFLNSLDKKDWEKSLDDFQAKITDQVIDEAVANYPREIYKISGKEIGDKLKARRDDIKREGMKYYEFLSTKVNITGSNKKEFFHVENDNGKVKLSVYKKIDEHDSVALMYRRVFDPEVTKEIVLYGFNGNDRFKVDDDVKTNMKIRIVGGKGLDTFDLQGTAKKYLYDLSTEANSYIRLKKTNKELSEDPSVLHYENEFQYNRTVFPSLQLGFNAEDGILLGLAVMRTTHGFREKPFKNYQKLNGLIAPSREAFQVKYRGEFTHTVGKNDLVINAGIISPTLNNFFGAGNETVFNKNNTLTFYRTRYRDITADVLLRKRFGKIASVSWGPTFMQYKADYDDNKNRIIANTALYDSASIFDDKWYAGGKLNFDIAYIDNPMYPKRGITWYSSFLATKSITENANSLTRATTDMTIYANVTGNSTVTAILRGGGGKIFSKNPEYFQLLSLGAQNYNRGFRKNRFAGDGLLYGGFETRIRLFNLKSFVLPGDFGIVSYYDIGRVWYEGEKSKKWHDSFGGGLFFAPYNMLMISATVGVSPEDRLFNFTVGSKINLTF